MSTINKAGLELIKEFEGFRSRAYLCPAGVWTVGYGHTQGVRSGDVVTREQAEALLRQDLTDAEHAVDKWVDVPLGGNQFAALVSFVFNVGSGAFKDSTLLRLLNRGDYLSVPGQLKRWNKSGGRVLKGLVRRREAEAKLWSAFDA